ncbi:MAG: hypothetical protein ICV63_06235 [Coleofasciculus sp. Co-bin14]|nr:hypothetical protein [Coleofasciculus sp. Co-bin14]
MLLMMLDLTPTLLPTAQGIGRRREVDLREIINRRLSKDYELLLVQERVYNLHGHDSFNLETTSAVSSDLR